MRLLTFLIIIPIVSVLVFSGCSLKKPDNTVVINDSEVTTIANNDCADLLNGVIEPFQDMQVFTDDSYTEVTITSREAWNVNELPDQVVELEGQGYVCYPLPLEFGEEDTSVAMEVMPAVTKVEWTCELYWSDYKYLEQSNVSEITALEGGGYSCSSQACFGESGDEEVVLCTK